MSAERLQKEAKRLEIDLSGTLKLNDVKKLIARHELRGATELLNSRAANQVLPQFLELLNAQQFQRCLAQQFGEAVLID